MTPWLAYRLMADGDVAHPVDAWIDAIPEDQYAPCPCGCGMKWRFAMKDGIEKHEHRFIDAFSRPVEVVEAQ